MQLTSFDMEEDSKAPVASKDFEELLLSLPKANFGGHLLYQYEGFWSRSFVVQATISSQKHFETQDGDIILASKPKTGTTWLKSLVFTITNRTLYKPNSQNHPLLTLNPHRLVPFLEYSQYAENSGPEFTTMKNDKLRLLSTHISYNSLPKSIKNNPNCKIVYICRNPFDTFVSYYEFFRSWLDVDDTFSINEAFNSFCNGVDISGPFFDHVLQYWNKSLEKPENVLFLKFEDLKEDTVAQLKRLADFLGFPFTLEEENEGVIQEISNFCSIKNMKDLDVNKTGHFESPHVKISNTHYYRKGEVGDWVNHFTPEMTQRLHKLMEEKLANTGLKFNLYSQI